MVKVKYLLIIGAILFVFSGCRGIENRIGSPISDNNKRTTLPNKYSYDFEDNHAGWVGGFADMPQAYKSNGYNLKFNYSVVPSNTKDNKAIVLTGHNKDNNLFMYITKKFNSNHGLEPNQNYLVNITFDFKNLSSQSNYQYIKAGIINYEPMVTMVEQSNGIYYYANMDKGNGESSGKDLITLENISTSINDTTSDFKSFNQTFNASTNAIGALWVVIGVDTVDQEAAELCFDNINVSFTKK